MRIKRELNISQRNDRSRDGESPALCTLNNTCLRRGRMRIKRELNISQRNDRSRDGENPASAPN